MGYESGVGHQTLRRFAKAMGTGVADLLIERRKGLAMTIRRRLLVFGLLAGVTVAGLLAAWMFWPRTTINGGNIARIEKGMTLAEVEAILGGPARDESSGR
jgi:hypothetical protein